MRNAVKEVVRIQDVEVVGSGSHIKGTYNPGKSDHDFTLRLKDTVDDDAALAQWKATRDQLTDNVFSETESAIENNLRRKLKDAGASSAQIDEAIKNARSSIKKQVHGVAEDFISRTTLYPAGSAGR